MTKAQRAEQQEAIARLRGWIKPGDTVYTILDHVSSSGMSRAIRVLVPTINGPSVESVAPNDQPTDYVRRDGISVDFIHPNWAVGKALGLRHWKRHGREQDALVVGGGGMDMGFHLVYELSSVLYGQRFCSQCQRRIPDDYPTDVTCGECDGEIVGGYTCLGKGRCPSSYHNNHRDTIQCPGTVVYNPDGPNSGDPCYWSREAVAWVIGSGDDIAPYDRVCPTCKGKGRLPNPDGPERFDLMHTDGYALRHRWL